MEVNIEPGWKKVLSEEFSKPYFVSLTEKVGEAYKAGAVFPTYENVFKTFELCPFSDVKVVILGQDPYHGEGQAEGLSFSVPDGEKIPPSLRNIYKEIISDIGKVDAADGNLTTWAKQGVLLLNATLTVLPGKPGSHQGIGWEVFTNEVIKKISEERKNVVFLLWGKYAQAKAELIDESKHLILKAPHPSPFSAHTGFLGCKHFSQANKYLKSAGQKEILW